MGDGRSVILTVTANPSVDRTLEAPGFRVGATLGARLVALRYAGKGVNVSRCLAALGTPSIATGLVDRSRADAFRRSLVAEGGGGAPGKPALVEPAFVDVEAPIRASTTIVDPDREGETHLRERGGAVTPAEVDELERVVTERAAPGVWVAACGSLPPGLDAERFARLLTTAREKGAHVALDTSGEGLRAARSVKVDLLKPNRVELAELAELPGREAASADDALAAARTLLGSCAEAVLVTLGADGAILVEESGASLARVEPETFVSSVGAGDAALAGYLWAESRGDGPADRLRAAVAAGAASLAEPVAGALDAERFRRLLGKTVCRPIAPGGADAGA
ncbi:MAG: 1-phosphofructokinase family hexose kinase [Planctomycetota bacterium]|jgi:1-phosphofructokinase family hexose kinase